MVMRLAIDVSMPSLSRMALKYFGPGFCAFNRALLVTLNSAWSAAAQSGLPRVSRSGGMPSGTGAGSTSWSSAKPGCA